MERLSPVDLRESKRQTDRLTFMLLAAIRDGNDVLARYLGGRIRALAEADGRAG